MHSWGNIIPEEWLYYININFECWIHRQDNEIVHHMNSPYKRTCITSTQNEAFFFFFFNEDCGDFPKFDIFKNEIIWYLDSC
jgi:hypothetical protein